MYYVHALRSCARARAFIITRVLLAHVTCQMDTYIVCRDGLVFCMTKNGRFPEADEPTFILMTRLERKLEQ